MLLSTQSIARRYCKDLAVSHASTKWNVVQRSGFRPMSHKQRQELLNSITREQKEYGTDHRSISETEDQMTHLEGYANFELFQGLSKKNAQKLGDRNEVVYDPYAELENDNAERAKHPKQERLLMELVDYFAQRIVYETEEQYRNRIGMNNKHFYNIPSDDVAFRGMPSTRADDPRFLQAKYIAFKGNELPFWHQHHQKIIERCYDIFQKKLWRVRDIAYCDHLCFVYVDNRHNMYSVSGRDGKGMFGAPGVMPSRGSE
eukprot:TRINITY_DN15871_c0_g1_i1.p1 TRINITY_DN15871_c0_g1~~TRINITY_DN15871_c0_g1_i1.p1  ORF type:complete len:285 (+),score=41.97 TRINITY_DN15871_c0_g1_i1:80-856(+)